MRKRDFWNFLDEVITERNHQINKGWTFQHDDTHTGGELVMAAVAYAMDNPYIYPKNWKYNKRANRRERLIKAIALLIAEIERIERIEAYGER